MHELKNILVVDDDKDLGETLTDLLTHEKYCVFWAGNGQTALEIIDRESIHLVLLDVLLPGMNGMDILKKILREYPASVVIMMSGHGSIQTAVEATRLGAYDWIEKPLEKERLLITLRNAEEKCRLIQEKTLLMTDVKYKYHMIGSSPAMKKICHFIDKVASKNISVLITGESGVGKEMVANAIHLNSPRVNQPFIRVNCAAVPDTLIESELFGHRKGSFTGAISHKMGKFQVADKGTLFLDEIGDLSVSAQSKILRALDTGEIEIVGGQETQKVDVRVITATNKNLTSLVQKGQFREDLYHRINIIEIPVPPLRERPEDIIDLAAYFIQKTCEEQNKSMKYLDPSAEAVLLAYPWPGNVRQLRNWVEKAVVLVDTSTINGHHTAGLLQFSDLMSEVQKAKTLKSARRTFEKGFIVHALMQNNWNVAQTARSLGLPRSTLYEKMKEYSIDSRSKKSDKLL